MRAWRWIGILALVSYLLMSFATTPAFAGIKEQPDEADYENSIAALIDRTVESYCVGSAAFKESRWEQAEKSFQTVHVLAERVLALEQGWVENVFHLGVFHVDVFHVPPSPAWRNNLKPISQKKQEMIDDFAQMTRMLHEK